MKDAYTHGHHSSVLHAHQVLQHLTNPVAALRETIEYDIASADEQTTIAAAWGEWASHPAAWLTVPNGELLIRI